MSKAKAAVDPVTKLTAESKGLAEDLAPGTKNSKNQEAGKEGVEKPGNLIIGQDLETDPASKAVDVGATALTAAAERDVSNSVTFPFISGTSS